MALNKYQTILRTELNNGICYSRHYLMVLGNFYPRLAGSFNLLLCVYNSYSSLFLVKQFISLLPGNTVCFVCLCTHIQAK